MMMMMMMVMMMMMCCSFVVGQRWWTSLALLQWQKVVSEARRYDEVTVLPNGSVRPAHLPHQPCSFAGLLHWREECLYGDQVPFSSSIRRYREGGFRSGLHPGGLLHTLHTYIHYRHFKRHLHLKWPVVHQQLHVIQNTAHRPSTQASYTASRVRPKRKISCAAAQIAATLTISFPRWRHMSLTSYWGQQRMSLTSYPGFVGFVSITVYSLFRNLFWKAFNGFLFTQLLCQAICAQRTPKGPK